MSRPTSITSRKFGAYTALLVWLAGCGTSSSGSGGEAAADGGSSLSGRWATVEVANGNCTGEAYPQTTNTIFVATQDGSVLDLVDTATGATYRGSVTGNSVTWNGVSSSGGGTLTIAFSGQLTDSTRIAGSASWTWSQGTYSCTGTTTITSVLLREDGGASQDGSVATDAFTADAATPGQDAASSPSDASSGSDASSASDARSTAEVDAWPDAGGSPDAAATTASDANMSPETGTATADASSADSDAELAPSTVLCVGTAAELTAALASAESATGPVVIELAGGTYSGNFIYYSSAAHALTLVGGFAPGCADGGVGAQAGADSGAGATLLDGAANGTVLSLQSPKSHDFTLRNLTLRNGSNVQHEGGGLRVVTSGALTVEDSVITGNTAATGGGIYASGVASLTVTGTTVSNNLFLGYSGDGGGICALDAKRVSIKGSMLTGNLRQSGSTYSLGAGGGLYVGSSFGSSSGLPPVRVEGCVITGNQAAQGAGVTVGGDVFSGDPNTIDIVNCVIADNAADGLGGTVGSTGGGLYLYGSVVTLTNNTITGNTGSTSAGGARITLPASTDSATLVNNIIWGNQTSSTDGSVTDLYIEDGDTERATVTFLGNDFPQSSTAYYATIPVTIGASNLNGVDPAFVSAATGDYRLAGGSPCTDEGVDAASGGATVDLLGVSRPAGLGTDIGAYESH